MSKSTLSKLRAAMTAKEFIRFNSRFESFPIRGYVLDIGPKFFLLAVVNDRIWFDGFECFRISDARNVEADPYTHFVETALRKRGERMPKKPRVSLASIESLVRTAGRAFPLLTVLREAIDPTVCWVGRVLSIGKGRVSVLQIEPNATWEKEASTFRISEFTRLNFGADYDNALHLVAGNPPPIEKTPKASSLVRKRSS